MKRATKRPEGFTKPAHWSDTPPPRPEARKPDAAGPDAAKDADDPDGLSPTRYGDWVRNGIAVDF